MRGLVLIALFVFTCTSMVQAQGDVDVFLIARNTGEKVLANDDTIRVFGFAETLSVQPNVPGPTMLMNEGDSVHIDLWNVSQGAPHTIHLHGLDVNQENDGVPHLSFDIPHMEHGYYHFKAPHAGTYLYHCHVASTVHVQAGMYGLVIVKPTDGSNTTWNDGYVYENEFSYLLSEIDTTWHSDAVLLHDHDTSLTIMPVDIPDYNPQFFLINGFSDQQLEEEGIAYSSTVNQQDFIRLSNIGYCGTRVIFPPELNATIISSDGRPLPTVEVSDTCYLFPGERYGVLTEPSEEFQDDIVFEYFDMNTLNLKGTQVVPVSVSGFFSVGDLTLEELSFSLSPNPAAQQTTLHFDLPQNAEVRVQLHDALGRLVESLPAQTLPQGPHALPLNTSGLKAGVYVVQLWVEGEVFVRSLVKG